MPVLITMLCINLFLVLGGVIPLDANGNYLLTFFKFNNNDIYQPANINNDLGNSINNLPSQGGGATTGLGFIDGIKLFFGVFNVILTTAWAPFQLLFYPSIDLPMIFRIMVALPLTVIYIFTLIGWLRGNE